jgi:hypothetical protein
MQDPMDIISRARCVIHNLCHSSRYGVPAESLSLHSAFGDYTAGTPMCQRGTGNAHLGAIWLLEGQYEGERSAPIFTALRPDLATVGLH